MIGAISMRISLMKASPRGCMRTPRLGSNLPRMIPSTIPSSTYTQSCAYQRFGRLRLTVPALAASTVISTFLGQHVEFAARTAAIFSHHLGQYLVQAVARNGSRDKFCNRADRCKLSRASQHRQQFNTLEFQ